MVSNIYCFVVYLGYKVVAKIDPRSDHMGFVVDKVALRWHFFQVLRFPLPILIPPTAPYPLIILTSDAA
jgi:hypothetical protein